MIGDTTGIIVLPGVLPAPKPADAEEPGALPAPEALTPSAVPTPPTAVPPVVAPITDPADDVARATAADTPTAKLDTSEIAALLSGRNGDPDPVPPTVPQDHRDNASGAVPPLEAAALLMGALPSPATQPLDAESLAEMSEPFEPFDPFAPFEAADEATPGADAATTLLPLSEADTTAFAAPAPAPPAPSADTILFPEATPAQTPSAAAPTAAVPTAVVAPDGPSGTGSARGGRPPRGGAAPGRANRTLFFVAGGLAAVLVLIALFALGTRLPSLFGAAGPAPSSSATAKTTPTPTPTPTPTVQPKPAGPKPAGTFAWSTLGGGECLQPYTSPWAETFTVVDCATPHAAQLVYTNLFSSDPAAPYPGADALAQQINVLCTKPGIINLDAAAAYPDLQLQGTYPATEKQWKDGQRSYYCFANRSGGEPLTASVAGPGPTG
ncbi:septum formation family protein [Leifsonia poae]|uniref:septum formation family protein n=1 Tax=Leifsonia poae TaxID=110933 RepID=UPI001CBD9DEE|nr:septum formation family protein [Leifsonia poae]